MQQTAGDQAIDYDDDGADVHSDTDVRTYSSARTMATSSKMYRHENGRTYHAYRDGQYMGPNDEKAKNHEAIVHHICLLTLEDNLFLAPIGEDPKNIIDLGTGSGIWAIDMADKFPSATVIGADLSPVPPGMHPDNCEFVVDDCTSEWVYPEDHFDFVHLRGLLGSINDWPALYKQIRAHLVPGGWIEHVEWNARCIPAEGTVLPKDSPPARWTQLALKVGESTGKPLDVPETMQQTIREAGFVDIVETRFQWPVGPWSKDARMKEIGRWNLRNWDEGIEGWAIAPYTRVLGWSYAEVQDWLKVVRASLREYRIYHEL